MHSLPCRQRKLDQYSAISWKRRETGYKLVLSFTKWNLHRLWGFRLIPNAVTSNDRDNVNGEIAVIMRHFAEFRST